jgi:cytochrome c5
MTMNGKYLIVGLALILSAQQGRPQSTPQKTPPKEAAGKPTSTTAQDQKQQQHQDNGSRIFEQNCSRCHNAPDGFSPRISSTIIRQMRICASLSAEEEKELVHFLNP